MFFHTPPSWHHQHPNYQARSVLPGTSGDGGRNRFPLTCLLQNHGSLWWIAAAFLPAYIHNTSFLSPFCHLIPPRRTSISSSSVRSQAYENLSPNLGRNESFHETGQHPESERALGRNRKTKARRLKARRVQKMARHPCPKCCCYWDLEPQSLCGSLPWSGGQQPKPGM